MMQPEKLRPLKTTLLTEYGVFSDKRIKNIDKGSRFIVDDRDKYPSFGSGGEPFGWFCQMFADVEDADAVLLTIRGPLPKSDHVQEWIDVNEMRESSNHYSITLTPKNVENLCQLAEALRAIVANGATYDTASHKYVCPRVASCLERLSRTLSGHWATT